MEHNADYTLVITEKEGVVYYGYFRDGEPVELYCEKRARESLLGNIYAARVERVAEGIGGAFLEIADGKKCYYSLKADRHAIKLSPGHEGKLYGGDILLVQIVKDAVKTKLPVADGNVSLPGKYFVLTLSDKRAGLSKKICDIQERERLTHIVEPFASDAYGIIIRTNAQRVSESELVYELQTLQNQYQELMRRALIAPGRTLLHRDLPHYITCAREIFGGELTKVVTDRQDIYEELRVFYQYDRDISDKLSLYQDAYALGKLYRLSHHYERARQRQVWLKSGGSLVIEQTEAMVVIDVNTGRVTKGKRQAQEIFYKMNCEAAQTIAEELRLRNLSGIILIDFINMKEKEQQESLLKILREACAKDRIPTRVVDMTALHLVEMTRNKVRRPLHEQWVIARAGSKEG